MRKSLLTCQPSDTGMLSGIASETVTPHGASSRLRAWQFVMISLPSIVIERDKLPVSAKTMQTLGRIVDSRALPQGFELECLTGYEPNDHMVFTVWSMRLRIPREPYGTTCITIQEKMIRSRLIGEEERKVIHKWQKEEQERGGIGCFERVQYAEERAKAAEMDRAK